MAEGMVSVGREGLGGVKTRPNAFPLRAVLIHISFDEHVMRQRVGFVGL
jgi:hypothetical protein